MKKQNIADFSGITAMLLRIEKKIDRLDNKSNLDKEYLTTHEACTYLGCSRGMIWKMVNDGKITRLKLDNGRTYYATQELKNIIENPPAEISAA